MHKGLKARSRSRIGAHSRRALPLLLIALSFGCAHGERASLSTSRPVASAHGSACSRDPARAAHERSAQTILEAYRREGGTWLDPLPVLVNEDFDMGLAMSLEGGMGAGLAAAARRERNVRKAKALAGLSLEAASTARLDALRCCGMDVYFLLWGAEQATLEMIVDVRADARASRIVAGPKLALGSTTSAERLSDAAAQLLDGLPCSAPARRCAGHGPADHPLLSRSGCAWCSACPPRR